MTRTLLDSTRETPHSSAQQRAILAIAYACNPRFGSEEGVGWGWVSAIAKRHKMDVITAEFHRPDIERAVANDPVLAKNVRFHYVSRKPWHYRPTRAWKLVENSALKPIMNLAYADWQRDAYRLACSLHEANHFDLIHLITYVGFRFPGQFWKMDIPLVWGPIGGLENTPWRFLPLLGMVGGAYYASRNVINSTQRRFLPGPKRAFAKASATKSIIAATEGIRQEIHRWYRHESRVICEIGSPPNIAATHSVRYPDEPLRLIWSGQHIPRKALPLLLKALARLDNRVNVPSSNFSLVANSFHSLDWRLTVLGAGPLTAKWKNLTQRLGIADRCEWLGWIARDEAVRRMQTAHVGVITSMQDLTSTVLVECLAAGLAIICFDHCGFSNVVTDTCGIKLPVHSPRQLSADLAMAIERLANDETERRRLATGALQQIGDFSWGKKAAALDDIYCAAIEQFAKNRQNSKV